MQSWLIGTHFDRYVSYKISFRLNARNYCNPAWSLIKVLKKLRPLKYGRIILVVGSILTMKLPIQNHHLFVRREEQSNTHSLLLDSRIKKRMIETPEGGPRQATFILSVDKKTTWHFDSLIKSISVIANGIELNWLCLQALSIKPVFCLCQNFQNRRI